MLNHLLTQASLTKTALASKLGLRLGTVSAWGDNPPQYAIAYLELYIDHKTATEAAQALGKWLERQAG